MTDMQATLTDYVVQGSKVFWPAAGITATSKSCSCGCHGCQHQSTAARLLQAPGSTHWSDESLQALKEFLIDTCYDLDAAQAKFLSLPYSAVRSMSICMDDDSLDRLYEEEPWLIKTLINMLS
jgi:hypothetical protein